MSLNLGLESLNNNATSRVVPFTPASAIEMANASDTITNLMQSLENYYDAARNAMLVKKAVKKFGKTQSILALVGQEGLDMAQSFSMEGMWEKIKNFLIKIWEKIKEWWGRFWGLFLSIESKTSSYISSLKGNKRLRHDVEFDAPNAHDVLTAATKAKEAVGVLRKIASGSAQESAMRLNGYTDEITALDHDGAILGPMKTGEMHRANGGGFNTQEHGGAVDIATGFDTMHYKLANTSECSRLATDLQNKVIKQFKDTKKDISDYTDKFLDKVKKMKITTQGSAGDAFGSGATADRKGAKATTEEQDAATRLFKQAAKLNNKRVASVVKAATQILVKLIAHTSLME